MTTTADSSSPQRSLDRRRVRRAQPSGGVRAALLVAAPILLLLLAITGWSYYQAYVVPLQQPVVRVNDTVFTMADYLERLRYLEAESQIYGRNLDYGVDPFQLLDDFRDTELIRQASPRLGVTVAEEEVTHALKERLNALPKEGEQTTPEELERNFQELFKQRLSQVNLSDAKYREVVRALTRRDKVRETLSIRVPAVAEQVHTLAIALSDEQGILDAQKRLEKGEDFGAIAKEKSVDEESRNNRGDLGWLPRRALEPAFDEVAFKLPTGGVSEPFWMKRSFWIVQVLGHDPARRVEGQAREKLKDRALEDWLEEERKQNRIERYFDSDRYEFVLSRLKEYRRPSQQGAQGQPRPDARG
ncbi:MAG: peptidylprolyl isomerase [Chloroflexi bacterium]|nr:peptidylprolyl isomerase [Chloroflexota bacterium]